MLASSRKQSYQLTNWGAYNASLVSRGDITVWFDEDVIDQWEHDNSVCRAGRPFVYSDLAIETLLTLRALFRLPYRQTEGLGRALVKLMGVAVAIPHHTSLQKRAAKLGITIAIDRPDGAIDLVVDSTGLKIYGEGEWKVKKHGVEGRRTWRKLHLAVDPDTHMIVAQSLTENNIHDGEQVGSLLEQVESDIDTFYGDGAYDQWKVHDLLQDQGIKATIPPRINAPGLFQVASSMATLAKNLYREMKRYEKFDPRAARAGKKKSVTIVAACQKLPCTA